MQWRAVGGEGVRDDDDDARMMRTIAAAMIKVMRTVAMEMVARVMARWRWRAMMTRRCGATAMEMTKQGHGSSADSSSGESTLTRT